MLSFVCPNCSDKDIVLRGKRYNLSGAKQLYRCNSCHSTFVEPDGFERIRHSKEDVVRAMHLHDDGLSLSKVQNQMWQHDGVKVTRWTIAEWHKKFGVFLKSAKRASHAKNKRASAL